jgi:hypothetical protein
LAISVTIAERKEADDLDIPQLSNRRSGVEIHRAEQMAIDRHAPQRVAGRCRSVDRAMGAWRRLRPSTRR